MQTNAGDVSSLSVKRFVIKIERFSKRIFATTWVNTISTVHNDPNPAVLLVEKAPQSSYRAVHYEREERRHAHGTFSIRSEGRIAP